MYPTNIGLLILLVLHSLQVGVLGIPATPRMPEVETLFKNIVARGNGPEKARSLWPWTEDSVSDFWGQLEYLGDTVRQYGEAGLKRFKTDAFVATQIEDIEKMFSELLEAGAALQADMMTLEAVQKRDGENDFIKDMENVLGQLFEVLKKQFPPPDHAPGHAERKETIHQALVQIEEALVTFLQRWGMPEEAIRVHLSKIIPPLENVMVMIGDLVEQHPALFSVLLLVLTAPLLKSVLLRPILNLVGFGPSGPIKGTMAAWAQRVFFGAAVEKGSWFAILQSAAMTSGWSFWRRSNIIARL